MFHSVPLQTTVKHGGSSVMIWDLFLEKQQGQLFPFMRELTAENIYKIKVTKFTLWLKHCFQRGNTIFQDDNASIYTARIVKERHKKHCNEVEHFLWRAQSLDFNIIWYLWLFLEI